MHICISICISIYIYIYREREGVNKSVIIVSRSPSAAPAFRPRESKIRKNQVQATMSRP